MRLFAVLGTGRFRPALFDGKVAAAVSVLLPTRALEQRCVTRFFGYRSVSQFSLIVSSDNSRLASLSLHLFLLSLLHHI